MRKNLYLIIFIIYSLLNSCTKKKVELPKIEIEGISEIYNHSSIWIFYELKNKDTLAILNKSNKILNTDWIFNIDKRLPMKKIVPFLQQMQEDKNKDSMHKKEGMLNFFSYVDILNNKISLIQFHPTKYTYSEKSYQKILRDSSKNKIVELNLNKDQLSLGGEKITNGKLNQKLHDMQFNDTINKLKIILKYNENTPYKDYLKTKAILNIAEIPIDTTEYIYKLK